MRQNSDSDGPRISDRQRRIVMHVLGVSLMFQALLLTSAILAAR